MTNTKTPSLTEALVAFQASVPTIPKNRTAKIPTKNGGSYSDSYVDLTDILEAIRQPLAHRLISRSRPVASTVRREGRRQSPTLRLQEHISVVGGNGFTNGFADTA